MSQELLGHFCRRPPFYYTPGSHWPLVPIHLLQETSVVTTEMSPSPFFLSSSLCETPQWPADSCGKDPFHTSFMVDSSILPPQPGHAQPPVVGSAGSMASLAMLVPSHENRTSPQHNPVSPIVCPVFICSTGRVHPGCSDASSVR